MLNNRHVLRCAREGDVRLKACDDLIGRVGAVAGEHHRCPEIRLIGKLETRRHNAKHSEVVPIQPDGLSEDFRVGSKSARPELMADQNNVFAAWTLLSYGKCPSEFRRDSQKRKQTGGYGSTEQPLGVPLSVRFEV